MEDLSAIPKSNPPSAVQVAVALVLLSWLLGCARVLVKNGWPVTIPQGIFSLVFFAIAYLICRSLHRGTNWVRWLTIVFTAIGMFALPWTLQTIPVQWERGIYVAQGVLQSVSIVLLLLPASNRWYRPNNSFKPKPLRGSA
jgi:hypothetical protein